MHKNPHQLIEGIIIGAYAAGASRAFIYIRGEYEEEADILDAAVSEAYSRGFLGERILRSDFSCSLVVHRGAGAYICGEETALLDSLEGKRGNPRLKPPFPANQGLYQGPTLINNVETLSNIPHVIAARRRLVPAVRHREVAGDQGGVDLRQRAAARQLRGRARGPVPAHRLRPCRRSLPGLAREGVVPRRVIGAGADRGAPRPALRLREHGAGRLDARLGSDHRGGRHGADRERRAAAGRVLPARVLREVRALPRGHQLDREDARARSTAARPRRWTSTSWPASRRTSSATASACWATRWRCRSGR